MLTRDQDKLAGMRTYIDGKMKRYDLLFAVHGGAFVIAKLEPQQLGNLNTPTLALGAMLFTIIMTVDIWVFAQGLKQDFFEARDNVFTWIGKMILLALGALLIIAWALAAQLAWYWIVVAVLVLGGATVAAHGWISTHPASSLAPQ
jgi:hypothetical protein